MKTTNVEVKRISKKKLDEIFEEIIALKTSKKAIESRLDELITLAESQYKKSPAEAEVILGNTYEMKKVPINRGKNIFDPSVIHSIMNKIPMERRQGLIGCKNFNGVNKRWHC